MIEYSITVKDENSKLTTRYLSYDNNFVFGKNNPTLCEEVQKAVDMFKKQENSEQPTVVVKGTMIW